MVFDTTQIISNEASESGGGVWADGGELIFLRSSELNLNNAADGGAVFITNGTRLFAADTVFRANMATGKGGGAIWAESDTVIHLRSSNFDSNSTAVGEFDQRLGGAIATSGESLRSDQTRFFNNKADRGGAVASTATESVFVRSQLLDNYAELAAGAGWFAASQVRFVGGRILNNQAEDNGGGLIISEGNISSDGELPPPVVAVLRDVEIASNFAGSGGGAIFSRGVELRILNSEIHDNASVRRGGALDMALNDLYVADTNFAFNDVTTFGQGGAMSSVHSTSFIERTTFDHNSASTGGAISVRTNENVTLASVSFTFNQSTLGGGGAISVGGNATVRSFNSSFESNTASSSGGAVHVVSTGRYVARGTTFTANTATGEGGAVLNYGTVNIARSTFDANSGIRGGAIKVGGENGILSIENGTRFTRNLAIANGAAISSTSSSITLVDGADFLDNSVEDGFGDLLFIGDVKFHRVTDSSFG